MPLAWVLAKTAASGSKWRVTRQLCGGNMKMFLLTVLFFPMTFLLSLYIEVDLSCQNNRQVSERSIRFQRSYGAYSLWVHYRIP